MKKTLLISYFALIVFTLNAQDLKPIQLLPHSTKKSCDLMDAFQKRQSFRSFDSKDLPLQELSDLLWAANGINRPESGKRTAPSAINAQDISIYVCKADGTWLYDAVLNQLKPVVTRDVRPLMDGSRTTNAPVLLLLVSDMAAFRGYKEDALPEANKNIREMGCLDAGIVSQNIALYCAGAGLGTVPRAMMDQKALKEALSLKNSQITWLNHPVGYPQTTR